MGGSGNEKNKNFEISSHKQHPTLGFPDPYHYTSLELLICIPRGPLNPFYDIPIWEIWRYKQNAHLVVAGWAERE